jgi:hypothetical protein
MDGKMEVVLNIEKNNEVILRQVKQVYELVSELSKL